jgi:DNA-binding NarL/FixJ family response regulator
MSIRVLIADDQELVRTGLRLIADSEPDLEVVGEAAEGEGAVHKARVLRPDVALMDIRMPGMDGIEATRRIVNADAATRVIVLTTFSADEYVFQALAAGASGFLLKDGPADGLIHAIHVVAGGDSLLAPSVTTGVIRRFAQQSPVREQPGQDELTERELEVWRLLSRGLSNAEIAAELVVGDATVKTHVARVLSKLGLRDRTQAVIAAYESGLVTPGEIAG